MLARRPARSVGTTLLSDRLRAPSRQFPPDPAESIRDIRAVALGEARRVVCYARQPDAWLHLAWPGSLLISPSSVVWRPVPGRRRRSRNLAGTSVTLVRQTEPADGGPRKPHVFSLVRCTTPGGRLDLIVPTADVPLVAHCLGADDLADARSLLSLARRPEPRAGGSSLQPGAWPRPRSSPVQVMPDAMSSSRLTSARCSWPRPSATRSVHLVVSPGHGGCPVPVTNVGRLGSRRRCRAGPQGWVMSSVRSS